MSTDAIDWSEAPEGATHRYGVKGLFYRFDFEAGTGEVFMPFDGEWQSGGSIKNYFIEGLDSGMIARPLETDETWSLTEEREGLTYDTLGELLADHVGDNRVLDSVDLAAGDTVYRGEKHYPDPATFIDAERVRIEIENHMDDNASANGFAEVSDGYPTVSAIAQDELDEFLEAWARKHLAPPFYNVRHIKPYTITTEDLEKAQ